MQELWNTLILIVSYSFYVIVVQYYNTTLFLYPQISHSYYCFPSQRLIPTCFPVSLLNKTILTILIFISLHPSGLKFSLGNSLKKTSLVGGLFVLINLLCLSGNLSISSLLLNDSIAE